MSYLSPKEKETIEKAVERIKLDTGLSYPENNLLDIADSLGVTVRSAALPDFQGKKVKGFIRWLLDEEKEDDRHIAKIYLNSEQSDTTKTFTLAHELGHFLLHKEKDNFRIDLQDYSEEGDPENQETEANYFAGALLMPTDKLTIALKNAKNIQEVAKSFGVSAPAVEARMKWLRR
jgi:IrrE N-terminal-like domain